MTSEATHTSEKPGAKANGETKPTKGNAPRGQNPRVISNPNDVMGGGGHAVTQNFQHVSAPLLCKLVGGTNAAYRLAA